MNYKDLLKALKTFGVKGALVCESPNIEEDAKLLKEYYLTNPQLTPCRLFQIPFRRCIISFR